MMIDEKAQAIMLSALAGAMTHLQVYDGETLLASLPVVAKGSDSLTITATPAVALATGTPNVCHLVGSVGRLMSFDEFKLGGVIVGGQVAIDEFVIDF